MIPPSSYLTPSILNLDVFTWKKQFDLLADHHITMLHYDVMDHHFVPNLSFGASVLQNITKHYPHFIVDCHLMVQIPSTTNLIKYIEPFRRANILTFHLESLNDRDLQTFLHEKNIKKGLALNPATPVQKVLPFLDQIERCLIMGVNPGFGGQTIFETTYEKIKMLQAYKTQNNLSFLIQVDGGVNVHNYRKCLAAGADLLVMGSYLFKQDLANALEALSNET